MSKRTVIELENILLHELGLETVQEKKWGVLSRSAYKLSKSFPAPFHIYGSFVPSNTGFFAVLMGIEHIRKCFPHFFKKGVEKGIYLFDCWEEKYELVRKYIDRFSLNPVFISARESAEYFASEFPGREIHWVPEGIDPSPFPEVSSEEKDIPVVQFGRRHEPYHEKLRKGCEEKGITYLYETEKGQLVFPHFEDFIKGLARTRISICFPSAETDTRRSGNISTLTQRYLQSMISKCLIVGSMPEDMKSLFPKDSIVEADMDDPAGQIQEILENFDRYIPLIDRNRELVLRDHTWKERVRRMGPYLQE